MNEVGKTPKPLTELGEFVYTRTYSRWLERYGRREKWHETVKRVVEYSIALEYKHRRDNGLFIDLKSLREEAKLMFDNIYNARQMTSGRTMWLGNGNPAINERYVSGNFNCSFTNIEKWEDLEDVMYLLSVGSGVGYKVTKKMAKNLAPMNPNIKVVNKEYKPKEKEDRLDQDKSILRIKDRVAHLEIADTKEGWVDGLRKILNLYQDTSKPVDEIHVNYDSVRPTGERLKTFGGTASGPEPLAKLYKGIEQSIKNEIDPSLDPLEVHDNGFVQVRPIHVMDISNMIAYTIIAGGVRRSAQIYLFDEDDYESIFAKYAMYGLWDIDQHNEVREKLIRANVEIPSWFDDIVFDKPTPDGKVGERKANLAHRAMSNNSVAFIEKPSDEYLELLFTMMRGEGEPKHIWAL